ncbi:SusD/RagB family nutrient-binding outer membrane lipoprotein [Mucilaginibacter sp. X5P1]|uniref:SusD/RagB family nutrient-binding outer membrane lipoprotein n=1 Tax=Mucilaginibacter sp. X5P1 TaxID=2723088 RepID=UPI001613EA71|nr:SusD/RagB family nutrient-binding outer membrane lipoprotein [Mucilaginibacter sp. X5P1]MBB6138738.1 hypothetical protein [Mucilaginibacter sp. X5P1]
MKKISLYTIGLILLASTGCKKYIDVNHDPNDPTDVQEAAILAPVEVVLSTEIYGGNSAFIVQNFMQTAAINQPPPQIGTYLEINSDLDGDWSAYYASALINLKIMNSKAEADGKTNYAAVAKILTALTLGNATDLWGDIPYSQAFKGTSNLTPVFDKQEVIYKDIQSLLDSAIVNINAASTIVPGSDDYFYSGDMTKWKKLAYTLKARYYMHLTKAPGYTAATQAQLALTALANGLASNDDDLQFAYPGAAGQENPWFDNFNPVSTAILASHFVDTLVSRTDPRLSKMVAPASSTGLYTGFQIGGNTGDLLSYSLPTAYYMGIGATNYIVSYSESLFLQAEATSIVSGYAAAQPIYQNAIRAHMSKLSVADADITTYLGKRGALTAANAVQRIIEEKYVANFLNLEIFNDWRRTGYPTLVKVPNALSDIPRRLLYPEVEIISNPQPQETAKLTDRVWWDAQ